MKLLSALLSCLLLLTSCGGGSDSDLPEGWLRVNIYSEPPTLDPRMTVDVISFQVLQHIFEGLTRFRPDGYAEPAAAESFDVSDDGLTYTFHLRDTFWWDGVPVVAEDFAYALQTSFSPSFPAQLGYLLFLIKNGHAVKAGTLPLDQLGVRAVDDKTLIIELVHPAPYFPEIVASNVGYPVRRDLDEQNPLWHGNAGPDYVGNGPFVLERWHHNSEIRLKKNPLYWDSDSVPSPGIRISIVSDPTTELNMFEEGELDYAGMPLSVGLPREAIPTLKEQGLLQIKPMTGVYNFTLNVDHPLLSNRKIRHALSLAIDREAIIEHILGTGETPATGLLPPMMALQKEPYFPYHDPVRAKELFAEGLDELGMTLDTMPSLTISYNTSEAHHRVAQAVQQGWYDAFGFRTQLENLEWKVYISKLQNRDYEIGRIGRVAIMFDPMGMLNSFSEDMKVNYTGWEDPKFNELIYRANRTVDQQERRRIMHEAEKLLIDARPFIPIYYYTNAYIKSPRLRGEVLTPSGMLDLRTAYLEKSADE